MKVEELQGEIQRLLINSTMQQQENELHLSRLVQCLRRAYLEMKVPGNKKADLRGAVTMTIGSAFETWLRGIFKNLKIKKKDIVIRFLSKAGIWIVGRPDIIVELDDGDHVIEVKSVNKSIFSNIERTNKPRWYDERQLRFYLMFTKIQKGIIIYMNRYSYVEIIDGIDLIKWKIFSIQRDKKIERVLRGRYKTLLTHLTNNTIPDAEGKNSSDDICHFCRFWNFCWQKEPKKLIGPRKAKPDVVSHVQKLLGR